MKVVINRCYGRFGLSEKGIEAYLKKKGFPCFKYEQTKYNFRDKINEWEKCDSFSAGGLFIYHYTKDYGDFIVGALPKDGYFYIGNVDRNDPDLVAVVEELGVAADGLHATLKVVEIPDDIDWEIDEYDGMESVHEVHRSWC